MKLVLIAALFATPAFAANEPFLTKSSGSGFGPAAYGRSEKCEFYASSVTVTRQYGSGEASIKEVQTLPLVELTGLEQVIAKALAEPVEDSPNGLCDGPTNGNSGGADGPTQLIFTTGGCGSPRKERMGPYSAILRELAAKYCPKTFD